MGHKFQNTLLTQCLQYYMAEGALKFKIIILPLILHNFFQDDKN